MVFYFGISFLGQGEEKDSKAKDHDAEAWTGVELMTVRPTPLE